MKVSHPGCSLPVALAVAVISLCIPAKVHAQNRSAMTPLPHPSAVLIELFTSEGCSDCPPADELLRQVSGRQTEDGQLIVGISEHVTYWNSLGWRDPFSADQYTERQNAYGTHFGLVSFSKPQMVVNGREQFVGSDRRALVAALASEAGRRQIELHITSAQIAEKNISFSYSTMGLPMNGSAQLIAVLVDDMDRSSVSRGENSGRNLTHVSVARAIAPLGALHETEQRSVSLPLPPSFTGNAGVGHHLVLFAQQNGSGAVLGIDSKPI